ncbi:MAG TPA: TIGR04222 domain-containing membrane protein [Thermoanaerobaculia bacterium]|nr:TIGR04222 domain-containing membrane protein [Thermoanaerobaculia bacterium]
MNPFDLRGPQFLFFYLILAGVLLAAISLLRRRLEARWTAHPMPVLHDPYAIASLRGGKNELLRVAVISLVDRGLLHASSDNLATTQAGQALQVRKRIEEDLLRYCVVVRKPEELFRSDALDAGVLEYERVLAQHRLVADDEIRRARSWLANGATAILLVVSLAKIAVALSRGRTNIAFLVLLTLFAIGFARKVASPRQTVRGKQFLAELQNLFQSLRLRASQIRPGGANADLALAAAVFGIDVLPHKDFAWARGLHPPQGSAGSSSCGSSGGSSCGGGGCGGGCGGCGG